MSECDGISLIRTATLRRIPSEVGIYSPDIESVRLVPKIKINRDGSVIIHFDDVWITEFATISN